MGWIAWILVLCLVLEVPSPSTAVAPIPHHRTPAQRAGFQCPAPSIDPKSLEGTGKVLLEHEQIQEAKQCLTEALQVRPDLVTAWFFLGKAHLLLGEADEARTCHQRVFQYTRQPHLELYASLATLYAEHRLWKDVRALLKSALQIQPFAPDLWAMLAEALYADDMLSDAENAWIMAVQQDPKNWKAFFNLGSIQFALGKMDGSLRSYRSAHDLNPSHPLTLYRLGLVLRSIGRLDEAATYHTRALSLNDSIAEAHSDLGYIYSQQGKWEEALRQYVASAQLNPELSGTFSNIGRLTMRFGQWRLAVKYLKEALLRRSDAVDAFQLGMALGSMKRFPDAVAALRACLDINRSNIPAWVELGMVYRELGDVVEAAKAFRTGLETYLGEVDQENSYALTEKEKRRRSGAPAAALGGLMRMIQDVCGDWNVRSAWAGHLQEWLAPLESEFGTPDHPPAPAVTLDPLLASMLPIDPKFTYALARVRSEQQIAHVKYIQWTPKRPANPSRGGRLRIAYLSSTFGQHTESHFLEGIIGSHDKEHFEVFCFSLVGSPILSEDGCEHLKDVSDKSYRDIATLINEDGIHILIDLDGQTWGGRPEIFALRPAPVQVVFPFSVTSTGAPFMDMLVTDRVVAPPEMAGFFKEHLLYMPESAFVGSHRQAHSAVIHQQAVRRGWPFWNYGLPKDDIVLASFSAPYKVDPEIFSVWMRILRHVPKTVLWLMSVSEESKTNLRTEAKMRDVDPERIIFAEGIPRAEHFQRIGLADLALDTSFINGRSTAMDVLWSAVPLITVAGNTSLARIASSLMMAIGGSAWIAHDLQEYEKKVVEMITDPQKLIRARAELSGWRHNRALFDTVRWVHEWEEGLRTLWELRASGSRRMHLLLCPQRSSKHRSRFFTSWVE